eukprot:CAMPEP_0197387642 /NCGR_PEP_ID=MMETSP1165-20131217/643_1 /TAXON_ID=284809 /ORGANISM="Chrysocystis fragilis, Strain CCMP3189" /LENGTH=315 /DNA_ID=CAMNT_0042912973 /DNA_START=500 /DNA_END=1445 /DNA_ORIENTATION=-
MHFSGNSRDLVSASQDGKLIIWNSHNMMKSHSIPLRSSWVMTCAFEQSRNDLVACGGLDNLCSIYRINQAQATRAISELAGHDGYLSCCRFVDEASILTTSGDSMCILWDIERNESVIRFTDHTGDVMSVALDPHSPKIFASGSCDSTAKLWDSRVSANPLVTFSGHDSDINAVAFFPDGRAFGSGSDDSTCQLFDIRCLMCINKFKSEKILCGITSVDFSRSGRLLFVDLSCVRFRFDSSLKVVPSEPELFDETVHQAGYDDFNAYAWDVTKDGMTVAQHWTLSGHDNRVSCLGVCPSGECLCTGSWDTLLKIW